jgi:hypothetical protein
MKRSLWLLFVGLALGFCALTTTSAQAQATRTWVSGVGDDANPCSRTAPCKTFAGAISKTQDCGEIDALDPGGFGGVTITKGITLDGGGGQVASVLVSGTPGITINNASSTCHSDIIRNLRIVGNAMGTTGVNVVTTTAPSAVIFEHDVIQAFTQQCINVNTSTPQFVTVMDSQLDLCTGGGINISSTVAFDKLNLIRSVLTTNSVGLTVGTNTQANVESSQINDNTTGGVLLTGTTGKIDLNQSSVSNNIGYGIQASAGTINLSNTSVVYNGGQGLMAAAGANINTWSNNWVVGNSPDGTRTGTVSPM